MLFGAEMALRASSGTAFSIVAVANNADELISHLERTQCDLLISDNSMPDGHFPLSELQLAVGTVIKGRQHLCPTFIRVLQAQNLTSCGTHAPRVSLSERGLEVVR